MWRDPSGVAALLDDWREKLAANPHKTTEADSPQIIREEWVDNNNLYQRLISFTEDNLLSSEGSIRHHGAVPTEDEELTPTVENIIVLTWLRLIHADLPGLVKQRYGTELRSQTLASLKPEILLALDSLLNELEYSCDVKVLRSAYQQQSKFTKSKKYLSSSTKSCPICKLSGKSNYDHFSTCKYLPEKDRKYLKSRQTVCIAGLVSSTVDQVLKYIKYPKHLPSTSTGQVLIY